MVLNQSFPFLLSLSNSSNSSNSSEGEGQMNPCMIHWNENQMCAIDVETTGLDPDWHEIIQVCILPLDANFNVRQDLLPFHINMKPYHPERWEDDIKNVMHKEKYIDILEHGFNADKAKDLLIEWIPKLKLVDTKYGVPKKIIPLGHNYAFDRSFIIKWLGLDTYNQYFDGRYRDTMTAVLFMNDRNGMHSQKIEYPKVNLKYLATLLNVELPRGHYALDDCIATAKIYKEITKRGLFG